MNWTVGGVGNPQEGMWTQNEAQGWWESHGKPVRTRSLYLQQLQDRLGETAVQNITTAVQRKGRIWDQLAAWAGEGRLADFSNDDDKEWPNQLSVKIRYYYNNGNKISPLREALGSPRRASVFSMARGGLRLDDPAIRKVNDMYVLGVSAWRHDDPAGRETSRRIYAESDYLLGKYTVPGDPLKNFLEDDRGVEDQATWKSGGIYHTLRTENTDHPAGTVQHYISKDGIDYTPLSGEPLLNGQKAIVFSDGRPRYYQRFGQPSVVLGGNDEVIAILVAALPVKEDGRGPDKIVTEEILIFPVFTPQ
jgi:hypothetical protein